MKVLDFIIIGAQKSGTTSLFRYINEHPQVYMPSDKDEIAFFCYDDIYNHGWQLFARQTFSDASLNQLWGMVSPHYMGDMRAAGRIHSKMPKVKLIALLRNPIDRAFSHYRMSVRRGIEKRSFIEAIEEQLSEVDLNSARQLPYCELSEIKCYLVWGEYNRILRTFRNYFSNDSMLVLFTEDLMSQPVSTFREVMKFLNLDIDFIPPTLGRHYHVGNPGQVDRITRSHLVNFYIKDVKKLQQILDREIPWQDWKKKPISCGKYQKEIHNNMFFNCEEVNAQSIKLESHRNPFTMKVGLHGSNCNNPKSIHPSTTDRLGRHRREYSTDLTVWTSSSSKQFNANINPQKVSSDDKRRGNNFHFKIVCMMRVKNEERWLAESLKKTAELVDAIVILDDGSTDRTPDICNNMSKVKTYFYQNEKKIDEVRDKNKLLEMALKLNPDWILALDGDEVLEDIAPQIIREAIASCTSHVSIFEFEFLYFWNDKIHYRVDGKYTNLWHPRLFRVKGQNTRALTFTLSVHGANFHCGSIPDNLVGEHQCINVKIKHYGYLLPELRKKKYEFYCKNDPVAAAEGYYEHLINETGIKLLLWSERCYKPPPNNKPSTYYEHSRPEVARLVPETAKRILDVGCGNGQLGALLKSRNKEIEVIGIEINPEAAAIAAKNLDQVLVMDIEAIKNLSRPSEYFDCIIFSDVLEHLRNPEQTLTFFKTYLDPKGCIVVSIPNIRHYSILYELLIKGRWEYREEGILDKTHLRFFTWESIKKLLKTIGFYAEKVEPVLQPSHPFIKPLLDTVALTGSDVKQAEAEMRVFQYVFRAYLRENIYTNNEETITEHVNVCEKNHDWVKTFKEKSTTLLDKTIATGEILIGPKRRSATGEDPRSFKLIQNGALNHPLVSIIIPVYNKLKLTHQCLKSIYKNTRYSNFEIIIVDNGSTDGTAEYLEKMKIKGVRALFHSENLGFVRGCNSGAGIARGEFVLFLNNDTEVQPDWLTSLLELALHKSDCGAVGSKLVYPDGKLQEAGGIIFSDGSGWNYGRNMNPDDPRFNFVRVVDYCSGACLLINKDLWDRLGGFDERYSPAYYEDTDICFGIRKLGYQVYYQPHSVIVHHEGQTAGTDLALGFKKYQEVNRIKFVEKWAAELKSQFSNDPKNIPQAHNRKAQKRILYVDPFLPEFDKASGSLRLYQILEILKQMDFHVTFIARGGLHKTRYCRLLEQLGIEVYAPDVKAMKVLGYQITGIRPIPYEILFKERKFDYAILSFWDIAEYYLPLVRKLSPKTKVIIDTVDIHFIRELREAELKKDHILKKKVLSNKKREITIYRKADSLWVVTDNDRNAIKEKIGNVPIKVVPNIHKDVHEEKIFETTYDLLFVGNFNHSPNQDAVRYFTKEIFPLILKDLPDVKLYIVGNNPPPVIKSLFSEKIIVTGYIKDLSPYLEKARVSVNPLRYGAGMKGKIGEALSWGLPVVTTSIGAEGMGLINGEHALIADDPQEFAKQTVRLYTDRKTWETLSRNGMELVRVNWSPGAVKQTIQSILAEPSRPSQLNPVVSIIILTYNALQYTKKCVVSIQKYTDCPHEIIFIDNGSTDGSVAYLRELVKRNPNYKLIENNTNLGFAAGNNQGMEKAKGDYLLLLNNDVLVSPHWLEKMVACAEMDSSIGLIGPLSNNVSGFQKVENIKYTNPDDYLDAAIEIARINHERYTPRRRIAGFAMLIKRTVYDEIGGLDEQFGSGNYEDDDYCLRAKKAGFKIMVAEEVFIHHFGSQSFKYNKIDYKDAITHNRQLFEKKWPIIDPKWLLEISGRLVDENDSYVSLGREALEQSDPSQALDYFKKVLDTDPINIEALYGQGIANQLLSKVEKAISIFNRVKEINPDFPGVYNSLGVLHLQLEKHAQALDYFRQCLRLDPNNLDAVRNISTVLIELKKYQEGVNILKSILKDNPEDVISLTQMGYLFWEAGRTKEAKQYFRNVIALDPQNSMAQQYLGLEVEVD